MKKARILICDDEAGVRESLKLILGNDHFLTFATNGQEAVDYIKKNDFDIAILDIKMPRLGGLDALPQIRRMKPKIRILMATGYESSDVAAQAIKLGADDYLVKSFYRRKVLTTIKTFLAE